MSAVVYVAYQNTADAWDVCRVVDDDLWLYDNCDYTSWQSLVPVSFGHSLDSAMAYLTKLNDNLQWAKELRE